MAFWDTLTRLAKDLMPGDVHGGKQITSVQDLGGGRVKVQYRGGTAYTFGSTDRVGVDRPTVDGSSRGVE